MGRAACGCMAAWMDAGIGLKDDLPMHAHHFMTITLVAISHGFKLHQIGEERQHAKMSAKRAVCHVPCAEPPDLTDLATTWHTVCMVQPPAVYVCACARTCVHTFHPCSHPSCHHATMASAAADSHQSLTDA